MRGETVCFAERSRFTWSETTQDDVDVHAVFDVAHPGFSCGVQPLPFVIDARNSAFDFVFPTFDSSSSIASDEACGVSTLHPSRAELARLVRQLPSRFRVVASERAR